MAFVVRAVQWQVEEDQVRTDRGNVGLMGVTCRARGFVCFFLPFGRVRFKLGPAAGRAFGSSGLSVGLAVGNCGQNIP